MIKRQIRLLLVDDHEVVRVGLKTLLTRHSDIRIVGEAGTMTEAIESAKRVKPNVVLMDARLPDGSGVEACRHILDELPQTRVLFLTSFSNTETVRAAVLAGAQGYLLKEIGSSALIDAIKKVAAGHSILDPLATKHVFRWMKSLSDPVQDSPMLSPQEQRIISLIAEGKTNKEIALAMGLSSKTVKNYLANVFEKLGISRRTQAAAFVAKHLDDRAL